MRTLSKKKKTKRRRPYIPLPDKRNLERGGQWLRGMIEVSEALDAGNKRAMDEVINEMQTPLLGRREREPGE